MLELLQTIFFTLLRFDPDDDGEGPDLPPGSPPTRKFEGPWFTTQLTLSLSIGFIAFLIFSYCRTRWPIVFAPRTVLKAFSPHEAHVHSAFLGWILPTIRTSELAVLQIVGLDAAVLLNFFKMSFQLFSVCSIFAIAILMPLNLKNNIDIGDGRTDGPMDDDWPTNVAPEDDGPTPGQDWLDMINDATSYLSVHLLFTYTFTILSLYFIYRNYRRFIRMRQLFSLEFVHSIPARTVMVKQLPQHLQTEKALAEYFENMGLSVESINICREVGSLKKLIDKRTDALLKLESAWVNYLGNPAVMETPRTADQDVMPLVDVDEPDVEDQRKKFVLPNRKRPTLRPGWFKAKVDALEYLEEEFQKVDELVNKRRRSGRFRATHTAFVTFEKMSSAQIAIQTVHATLPAQCITRPAPEARDIIWSAMGRPVGSAYAREFIVFGAMCLLFFFWVFPVSALASLLSYQEIKRVWPWLWELIDSNEQIRAIVQNSLPSISLITLNALLPFLLEGLTYIQGYPARSWIEYSLLKKYFLFLLVNVVFIFLLASTYWQLVRDLANSPAKIPEKLAQQLQKGRARHFFLSYVILQGLGIMPLQLLNLGVLLPRMFYRALITRTPRDFAELNAPPMINYGVVYPQAILVFVITLLYSVIQPLILIFGAVYFGVGYVVYKYKLLFVFYKPYESQGQAWPITFIRLIWGVVIFLIFMIGIFILKKAFIISSLLAPLLLFTVVWTWYVDKQFRPLSKYVSLSSVSEVQRGEDTADVVRLREGHPVTWSQSNLNRRRYAQNDETLYVAPEDERTDYSQPPMANWYSGVLNTGKRRYGHPALNGVLPQPWLPLKKGQSITNGGHPDIAGIPHDAKPVVLTLRKRFSLRPAPAAASDGVPQQPSSTRRPDGDDTAHDDQSHAPSLNDASRNPWDEDGSTAGPSRGRTGASSHGRHLSHRLSFDHASGVIMLPDDEDWLEESDSDEDYGATTVNMNQSVDSIATDLQQAWAGPTSPGAQSPSKQRGLSSSMLFVGSSPSPLISAPRSTVLPALKVEAPVTACPTSSKPLIIDKLYPLPDLAKVA
ncbi:hypothetical protein EIP91_007958 [Steccherinum ochraceum]|uniref:Calcium permeable stress-gated cation channel 1 n=1 Tax=Steccherinum ochraceum TaxID=92696 RepID=A0A4R0R3J1_9APHY|nr:hypothetical protein EIP91_007958 [Steccherinum ochraceum]